jgi:hypothetical protein
LGSDRNRTVVAPQLMHFPGCRLGYERLEKHGSSLAGASTGLACKPMNYVASSECVSIEIENVLVS